MLGDCKRVELGGEREVLKVMVVEMGGEMDMDMEMESVKEYKRKLSSDTNCTDNSKSEVYESRK